jgi:hypothetical protein
MVVGAAVAEAELEDHAPSLTGPGDGVIEANQLCLQPPDGAFEAAHARDSAPRRWRMSCPHAVGGASNLTLIG